MKVEYVEWNEPLFGPDHEVYGNTIVRATVKDVINWQRVVRWVGKVDVSDEDILDHFMVTNWAWFKEYDE